MPRIKYKMETYFERNNVASVAQSATESLQKYTLHTNNTNKTKSSMFFNKLPYFVKFFYYISYLIT